MITIDFTTACLFYLGMTLFTMLLIGIFNNNKKKQIQRVEDSKLFVCEYCQHAYIDLVEAYVTTCPQCNLLNKSNSYSRNKKSTRTLKDLLFRVKYVLLRRKR